MERPINTSLTRNFRVTVITIVLFHTVGLIGFLIPAFRPLFIKLVPFHLLLMLGCFLVSHEGSGRRMASFLFGAGITGFIVELLGVHTGELFGNYAYGATLGPKLADIPLMIGVNWAILIYAMGNMLKTESLKNKHIRSLIGAWLLVMLDLFIEPVAIKFDYWSWYNNLVPLRNYISWFIVSFFLLEFYYALGFKKQNRLGTVMYVTQLLFFIILSLWAK